MSVAAEARRLLAAGMSVIPIAADATKKPTVKWRQWQNALPGVKEMVFWFPLSYTGGLAVIAGAVSGNVEVIDFDDMDAYGRWKFKLHEHQELRSRLVVTRTPSPGIQVWYRCVEPVPGNQKLARRPKKDGGWEVLIETRGEGGYAIIPPSPGECHPSGKPYEMVRGDLADLPVLTAGEREILLSAARALDEWREPEHPTKQPKPAAPASGDLTSWDDYNARGDWTELLEKHGWTHIGNRGEVEDWRRPGKHEEAASATLGHVAPGIFHVFSTNAAPFEAEKSVDLFGAYARLEHGGDFAEAARVLRAEGFGGPASVSIKPPQRREVCRSRIEGADGAAEGEEPLESPQDARSAKRRAELERDRQIISAGELLDKEFEPLRWAVPGIVPEGLSILAGGPKTGKSWLAMHMAVAVASGGSLFGQLPTVKGGALYLALEDSQRRLKERLGKVLAGEPAPENLYLVTHWDVLGDGFSERLDTWLGEHPECRLVIVDVLQRVRPRTRDKTKTEYQDDSDVMEALQEVPRDRRVAMVMIHHTRKMTAPDPFDMVSGSQGVTGGADSILVLMRQRDQKDATLHAISREADFDAMALEWDSQLCMWKLLGKAADHNLSAERKRVLEFLRKATMEWGPSDVAGALNMNPGSMRYLLGQMAQAGQITKTGYGKYVMTEIQKLSNIGPHTAHTPHALHTLSSPHGEEAGYEPGCEV